MKQEKSKFSFDTVEDFDDHIKLSIPSFEIVDHIIFSLSSHFVERNTNVYDIGCSTGRLLKFLSANNTIGGVSFVGYDISKNLLKPDNSDSLSFFIRDVTDPSLKLFNTNLIISVFTLQFIERNKRHLLLSKIYESLNKGGAFIVFEKTYCEDGFFESIFTKTHYDFKRNYFSEQEIILKEDSLRTIMRPLSVAENEKEFFDAGFLKFDIVWKSLGFVGWVCVK